MLYKYRYLFFIVLIVAVCSCKSKKDKQAPLADKDSLQKRLLTSDITLPGGFSSQTKITFDSNAISLFIQQRPGFKNFETRIRKFYANRKFAYAWYDQEGLIEQAGNLYNKISNIKEEGLPVELLYAAEFHRMMDDSAGTGFAKADPQIEIMITAQYFFYAVNVWSGMGTKAMQAMEWDLPQKKISYESLLDSLLEMPSSMFMVTEPVFRQYALLKNYLKKYREIEASGWWPLIQADKKVYRKGDTSNVIAAIRKRLFLTGDISVDDQSPVFDQSLENATKNFQQRYGYIDNGEINSKLITAFNIPLSKKIEQIVVNMERCRWLPVSLKGDYFIVNVPEFRFHAFENDSLAWSMNVVVGTSMNKTAIFTGTMTNVVFSPYWNIPPGIMKKETLPAIRRSSKYMARNHLEWNGKNLRQVPGPWNALGKVKFLFPNSHSIYLHDTPSKSLFSKEQRAFSHGCIRVAEPKRLAMYVLRNQLEWTESRIDSAMNSNKEQYVNIKDPIPVFIAYFTAWVDSKGRLNFRNDIYNRDSKLAGMIMENSKL